MQSSWLVNIFVVFFVVNAASALQCFSCNSQTDGCLCEDMFNLEFNGTYLLETTSDGSQRMVEMGERPYEYLIECPEKPEAYTGYEPTAPFCRKIKTYIYDKNKGTVLRYQRDCGYNPQEGKEVTEEFEGGCKIMKSDDFHIETCQCNSDACNSATGLSVGLLSSLLPLFLAQFLRY